MMLFTRAVARDFRALFGRCVAGRPRGPAPPVVVSIKGGTRTLAATTSEGVTLTHIAPTSKESDDLLVLPASVLAEVEDGTDEGVTLDRSSKFRGILRWNGEGKPRALSVELILPGKQHELPTPPKLTTVSAKLLTALHECGRTAARESGRYALSRIQVRGKCGRVIGTDGKVALLFQGFQFPFADSVLVPALPVFGSKPLTRGEGTRVGRSATHLVVAVGPWSVWLPADTRAKYPDVAGVVPRHAPTTAAIDARDAAELLRLLPGLPGATHEHRPVTLDVSGGVRVRGHDDATGATKEVILVRSPAAGPPMQLAVDRRVLARLLSLGCHTLHLTPNKPLGADGGGVTLVAAPLDPALIVMSSDEADRVSTDDAEPNHLVPVHPTEERSSMKPPTNGPSPNGRHDLPSVEPPDPLKLAEALRDALADATAKAARLVAALRQGKKEKKVLANVLSNLKQLNLEGRGA